MKNSPLFQVLAAIVSMVFLLSNAANPPNGNTGAPFDGTCGNGGCHNPQNAAYDGQVTISGIPADIQPNTTYSVTLSVQASAGSPTKAGFQMVVVQGNNMNCGNLTATGDCGTEFAGGREYVEHRGAKLLSGGFTSWSFTWISPATSNGNVVNVYFTGNLVNGTGTNQFDKVVWGSESFTFAGSTPLTLSITNVSNVTCNGGNNGSATAVAGGGTPPYNYLWSNGETNATATMLPAGIATVTLTDNGGQQTTKTQNITQPSTIVVNTSVAGQVNCINNAIITATPVGGIPGYTYLWPDFSTSNTFAATAPGSYIVTVTDVNGCTKTGSASVTGNTLPPTASATGGTLTCGSPSIQISATTNAGSPAFEWSGPGGFSSTLQNPTVSAAGIYTVEITNNANGCTATATATVGSNISIPTASASASGSLNCLNTSVNISATTNAGTATFAWTGPNGFTSNLQNPSVSVAGNYNVVVTNTANGCSNSATTTVSSNTTAPTATATGGTLTCISTSVNITSSTNASPALFLWTGPNGYTSTQQNPTVSVAGNYTVVIGNPANGCTSTATAIVSSNTAAPNASATVATLTCTTTNAQICGISTTPNAVFAWSGPNGFTSSIPCPSISQPGNYIVTVTNPANGCTATATATVNQDIAPPGATASGGTLTCTTTSITLSGNSTAPGSTFSWTGPNGFTSNLSNPTVSIAGNYVLTTTGTNGCTSTATAIVDQNVALPTAAIATPGNLNCSQTTLTLNANGSSSGANFSYLWTTTNGNIVSGGTTLNPNVNAPGTYNLLVTNTSNGCTSTASTVVNQSPAVAVVATSQSVSCFGGTNGLASATASGGVGNFNFSWSNGGTGASISNLPAGNYTVTATDSEGCTKTATATVSQPNQLIVNASATAETAAGANNGTATANPTGGTPGFTYLWSNGATTQTITNLAPGGYSVTTTDGNGCTAIQTVTVNSFNCALAISTASTNVNCFGENNGTATVSMTGANQPAQILWKNSSGTTVGTTAIVSNLAPGNYTVQVTDANNCSATGSVSISQPTILAANATATGETAVGANNGTASASPTGGTSPYTFLWSNGSTTANLTNLAPGIYTISVTDAHGCQSTQSATVNAFNCVLTTTISAQPVSCFGGNNGTASISVAGGTSPYIYVWSNGQTGATAINLIAGNYTATATDNAGCATTASVSVGQPTALTAQIVDVQQIICAEDKSGAATVQPGGGTSGYNFLWSNGQTTATATGLGAGIFSVVVTDANGCTKSATGTLAATDAVAPTIVCPQNVVKCGEGAVNFPAATATDNCNLPADAVKQTAGPASGSNFPLGNTLIEFLATDANGNSAKCSFSIQTVANPTVTVDKVTPVEDFPSGSISITAPGTNTYFWTGPNGFTSTNEDIENLGAPGDYTVIVTNEFGCTTKLTQFVDVLIATGSPEAFGGLKIFPNPSIFGEVFFENKNDQPLAVQIFDPAGKFLEKFEVGGQDVFRMDISKNHLPAGLYAARFVRADGKSVVKRFAIQ